ncbi:hypothetical protein SASPL_136652 [Salvia splendens]|uniref:GDSL esterase/lipase EXL3 n=1 Tax=Salvia splendens TaxID=180675 RepID=A0A8X8X066_SALSN|nr:hypothetical protein SASPL_136652 [Salvia splendens]
MKGNSPLVSLPFLLFLSITTTPSAATHGPSAIYDSILDAGNNNHILTLCRADHDPYGSDFPGRSHTGRFSKGKIPGDFLVAAYGLKDQLPAYSDFAVTDKDLITGKLRKASARKIALVGVPPIGCMPIDAFTNIPLIKNESGDPLRPECRDDHNSDAQQYNTNLATRVKKMMEAMPDLKIVYVDYYNPMMNMINKPYQYGFKTTLTSCCGTGAIELVPLCNMVSLMCHDHSEYVFWDSVNPTEAAYKVVAKSFKDRALIIPAAAATARPSAIYAFGDALLDPGNNNNLPTVCRANHKPYGLDFPGRSPTGRFTNGKLPGDMLVSAFRIKDLLPAYADSTVDVYRLLTGVSFASACSGYHDVTAASVGVVNLDKQRECKAKHNKDAKEYNVKLQVRVRRMMVAMPTLKVVYMDIFNPMMEMIDKPNQFGFKSTVEGCCGSGWVELGPLCNVASVA